MLRRCLQIARLLRFLAHDLHRQFLRDCPIFEGFLVSQGIILLKYWLEVSEKEQHKRVLVIFGANWCYDCHVLDLAFHRPDIEPVLKKNYEVVHVDVGEGDKNQDLMQQYQVPMKKGIPGIAVLDSDGKLLYSQQGGEFEKARALAPEDVLAFLNKWKPASR